MSTVSHEKLLFDRLCRGYEAKNLLLRTPAFITFCGGNIDENRLNDFLATKQGKRLADKLTYPMLPLKRPVNAWQDESDKQRNWLSLRVDLSASKESIMAAFKFELNQYHNSKSEQKTNSWKLDEIIEDFCFYDLVKKHGGDAKGAITKAMHEVFPESIGQFIPDNPRINKIYQMLKRIYNRIKKDIPS